MSRHEIYFESGIDLNKNKIPKSLNESRVFLLWNYMKIKRNGFRSIRWKMFIANSYKII